MEAWLTFSTIALASTFFWSIVYGEVMWDVITGEYFRESRRDACMTVLVQAYTLAALSAIPTWLIYLK